MLAKASTNEVSTRNETSRVVYDRCPAFCPRSPPTHGSKSRSPARPRIRGGQGTNRRASQRIRTSNLRLRRPSLYPAELVTRGAPGRSPAADREQDLALGLRSEGTPGFRPVESRESDGTALEAAAVRGGEARAPRPVEQSARTDGRRTSPPSGEGARCAWMRRACPPWTPRVDARRARRARAPAASGTGPPRPRGRSSAL